MKVYNRADPDRPPMAGHVNLSRFNKVVYSHSAAFEPHPVRLDWQVASGAHDEIRLNPETVELWLRDTLERAIPALEELSSDPAMLAWLTDAGNRVDHHDLRMAALLAHHLRRDEEIPALLAQAASMRAMEDADHLALGHKLDYRSDDQDRYPQDWSDAKFEQFLAAAPRD